MPIFEYGCNKCGFMNEYLIGNSSTSEIVPEICPKCNNGKMEKIFSPREIGIDFVGSGFYINDYGKHAWKKNLSIKDQINVLTPDENGKYKDPY